MELNDLGIDLSASSSETTQLTSVKERGEATMLNGSVKEIVADLINRLENDAKIL